MWIALAALILSVPAFAASGSAQSENAEPPEGPVLKNKSIPRPEDRVDINHASVEELMKVPGMTQPWAARIVRFRPYRTKQDLVEEGVLPSAVYDRIKDSIIAHKNPQ